jgi:metal-responsive CopG/Arc/MetJ family transcriptional regulator
MNTNKIAITVERDLLLRVDRLVREHRFPNRSRVFQEAVREKLDRLEGGRLAREATKLNPEFEQQLADEGLTGEVEKWPVY